MGIEDGVPELKTKWGQTLSDFTQLLIPAMLIGFTKGKALKALRNRGMLKNIPLKSAGDRFGNLADVGTELVGIISAAS